MKSMILVALALVAAVVADAPEPYKILRSDYVQNPEGSYNFNYETENGISRAETGEIKQAVDEDNKPHDVVVVRGSYAYTGPDGVPVSINYIADETGFHAEGDSIPKPAGR